MLRWLKHRSLLLERMQNRRKAWYSGVLASDLIVWQRDSVARGTAIGLFWAFMPIPFQMLPMLLFCYLVRGNLLIGLIFVWMTNPLTIFPVLLLEYRIGEGIFSMFAAVEASLDIASTSFYQAFTGGLRYVLTGALILSSVFGITGYFLVLTTFDYSARRRARQRAQQVRLIEQQRRRQHGSPPAED